MVVGLAGEQAGFVLHVPVQAPRDGELSLCHLGYDRPQSLLAHPQRATGQELKQVTGRVLGAFGLRLSAMAGCEHGRGFRTAVVRVEEHELVRTVSWQSAGLASTGNSTYMLVRNGSDLVDRVDGVLHQIGVVSAVNGEWENDYRARIRRLAVRAAVDDLQMRSVESPLRTDACTLCGYCTQAADALACVGRRVHERPISASPSRCCR